MRNKVFISFLVVFSLFFVNAQKYTITKVDSTKTYYLIYIKDNMNLEKVILSKKQCYSKSNYRIIVGKKYNLNPIKHSQLPAIDIKYIKKEFNQTPSIYFEDIDICRLNTDCIVYECDNLCGLYLTASYKRQRKLKTPMSRICNPAPSNRQKF